MKFKESSILSKNISKNKIFFQENISSKKRWYVVQVYSTYENRVKDQIKERIKLENIGHFFGKILVPVEKIVEIRNSQKRKMDKKIFPGYLLINMDMNEESWRLVRRTPRVNGFVGGTNEKPLPISIKDVKKFFDFFKIKNKKSLDTKTVLNIGQMVRVLDGPFSDFTGIVEDINYDKSRVHVSVSIFGRLTPVELDFSQVEKDI